MGTFAAMSQQKENELNQEIVALKNSLKEARENLDSALLAGSIAANAPALIDGSNQQLLKVEEELAKSRAESTASK